MEGVLLSREGQATKDVLDGMYDLDGKMLFRIDGGLTCFGRHVPARAPRMAGDDYDQLFERSRGRWLADGSSHLTHNLGGAPSQDVVAIAIPGTL